MSIVFDNTEDIEQGYLFSPKDSVSPPPQDRSHISDTARTILREHLHDLRAIEGAPTASDEEILRLSLPPFYTACPNPFLGDFLADSTKETDPYIERGPLTQDISVGKNDPLYFAHYYSTKVPPQAIVPYILHFTQPGDVVFDGFCGTGMTGVAAQLCDQVRLSVSSNAQAGARKAVLSDLSPAATFIASITNSIALLEPYLDEYEDIVRRVASEHQSYLETAHVGWLRGEASNSKRHNANKPPGVQRGRIEYVVWSDVFHCAECGSDIVYWDLVFRGPGQPPPGRMLCPNCGAVQTIRTLERAWRAYLDPELGQVIQQAKQVPVLINYSVGKARFEKVPDDNDVALLNTLDDTPAPNQVPIVQMPDGFNTAQPRLSHGFTHVHHFFTRRNLLLMTALWSRFNAIEDPVARCGGLFLLTGTIQRVCRLNRYMPTHDRHVGPLSGTLYVSQLTAEIPVTNYALDRLNDLRRCAQGPTGRGVAVSTQSATELSNIPASSIDYIFTDPPFGGNLNYSELNVLVEAWIGVGTNNEREAIVNDIQHKDLRDYQLLMTRSFKEFHRVLKPGRWITVEFHNSQNAVWTAIQEALGEAGFIIADVRTLDKQKGTTKQLSYSATVKQDLIISAYKVASDLEEQFSLEAGSAKGVWDFVRAHLKQLPVFVQTKEDQAVIVAERQNYLLFDRMVAFHVQRGIAIPMSAAEFYAGLSLRFKHFDGMYFLPEQLDFYKLKRTTVPQQPELFVSDESSAIVWLRLQLSDKPQTQQELTPQFLQRTTAWRKHEVRLELRDILEENFLLYNGQGSIPAQIVSWMKKSAALRELMQKEGREREDGNLETEDQLLKAAARDRWYLPDPNRAIDLERVRLRDLLKEFAAYQQGSGKITQFRTEAVRAGFKQAYNDRDFATIVRFSERVPVNVIQEDRELLMYCDVASLRA